MLAIERASANQLANAGFETDAVLGQEPIPVPSDWSTFGVANAASANLDPVRTGIGSLQLVGAGAFGVPGAFQTLPASPGQVWDLQGYMLTKEALPANATFGLLKIVFGDGVGDLQIPAENVVAGQADSPDFPGIVALPQLNSASIVGAWQLAHAAGVAPAGTTEVRLYALLVDEAPAIVYFDDLAAGIAGDFDGDSSVDGDDLQVWKNAFGSTAAADADGDGDTDGADFLIWQRSAAPPAIAAVPEPAAAALAAVGLALACRRRQR
jgi:hypothetical protein